MLNSFKTFTASLDLSSPADEKPMRGRDRHDLYWSCVSAGVESLLMNTPAPHELSLRKPKGGGQRRGRGRQRAQRIHVTVDERFWRELWEDLLLPSRRARDVFVELLRARREETAEETSQPFLELGEVTPALLILTAYLERLGRDGKPSAYHLVPEELEAFMEARGYCHQDISATIMRWLDGSDGTEGVHALRGVYQCYWRSLRRALPELPEAERVVEAPVEQPLDLFLGRPVIMPTHSSDSANAGASEPLEDQPSAKPPRRHSPKRNPSRQDVYSPPETSLPSTPLPSATEHFDQREILNELNRLREENDKLSELRFDQVLLSMLNPALLHQAPLDEWTRSAETTSLDALLLREIKSVLLRGQLRLLGEVGEEVSIELPHKHYQLEQTRLPKQKRGERRYRVVKRGIALGGSVVTPITLTPQED